MQAVIYQYRPLILTAGHTFGLNVNLKRDSHCVMHLTQCEHSLTLLDSSSDNDDVVEEFGLIVEQKLAQVTAR